MKACILNGVKEWSFSETPYPENYDKDNYAIIKTTLNGICSTDILRSMKNGFYSYPIVPGHEIIGQIEEIKGNKDLNINDRVAVYPLIPCEKCVHCSNKDPNLCDNYNFLGSRTNGGYSEFLVAPIKNLVKIPDNVSNEKAVFTEPLAVTLHSFKIAESFLKPKNILIIGLGPIGLLVAMWAKYKGIKNVYGIDRNKNRFEIFKKIGFDNCIDTKSNDLEKFNQDDIKFDSVFECSGSVLLQKIGINKTMKKGQFILLSNPNDDLLMDKETYSKILRSEINFRGSWSSKISPDNEWKEVLFLLSQNLLDPSILISNKIKLSELPTTMPLMYEKKFEFIKVVVE